CKIAISFFATPPVLHTTSLLLMIIPLLLFSVFALVGRHERRSRLRALFRSETVVEDLLSDATAEPTMKLGEFLQKRYDDAHQVSRYALPLVIFHLPYIFGLYWSCIS